MNEIILASFKLNELKEMISQAVREEMNNFQENQQAKEGPEYLTRKQVAKKLNITLPTLHAWTKQNVLKSYRIQGRVLYMVTEVREVINNQANGSK